MAITATVAQGQHYDNHDYVLTKTWLVSMEADISFQSSCEYDLGDNDQYDWNKLIGFGDGGFGTTSARWGWRWNLEDEMIEIAPYVHHGNQTLLPPNTQWIQVDLNTSFHVKIEVDKANQRYIFTYNGSTIHYVNVSSSLASAYSGQATADLFYFGGNELAPHEMKIDYDNIAYTAKPRTLDVTGEASGGVTFTATKADGSPYSYYLAMNNTVTTPCVEPYSASTTDVTILENSVC